MQQLGVNKADLIESAYMDLLEKLRAPSASCTVGTKF